MTEKLFGVKKLDSRNFFVRKGAQVLAYFTDNDLDSRGDRYKARVAHLATALSFFGGIDFAIHQVTADNFFAGLLIAGFFGVVGEAARIMSKSDGRKPLEPADFH